MPRRIFLHALVVACAAAAGCARDPADELCPPVGTGDLVVTELRRAQDGDSWGQWVELYNATGSALDLEGAVLDLRSVDGSIDQPILVRRSLSVDAGGYVVLGDYSDAELAEHDHVDYGFRRDPEAATPFPDAGIATATSCGVAIDELIFRSLPGAGTWSLGAAPSATGNDDEAAWCNDTTPSTDTTKVGLPGTPGAANHPCT